MTDEAIQKAQAALAVAGQRLRAAQSEVDRTVLILQNAKQDRGDGARMIAVGAIRSATEHLEAARVAVGTDARRACGG